MKQDWEKLAEVGDLSGALQQVLDNQEVFLEYQKWRAKQLAAFHKELVKQGFSPHEILELLKIESIKGTL